jgi:hypothetical protein
MTWSEDNLQPMHRALIAAGRNSDSFLPYVARMSDATSNKAVL